MKEEFEEMLDLDMEKLGKGVDVARNLIIILFLSYCAFYLNMFFLKAAAALAILLKIYFINVSIKGRSGPEASKARGVSRLLSNLLILVIILFTIFNKLTGSKY